MSADHVSSATDGWSPVDKSVVTEAAAVPGVRAVSGITQDGGQAFGDVEIVNGIDPQTLPQVFRFDWADGNDTVPGRSAPTARSSTRAGPPSTG